MSEEIKKYITKIIKTEETNTGEGEKVEVEVEYFVKDSDARESISNLNEQVGDLEEITDKPASENTVVNNINSIKSGIGNLEEITDKPESKDNTIVNNINSIKSEISGINSKIGDFSDQENFESIKSEISGINSKIGNLEEITDKPVSGNTVVNNINSVKSEISEINSKIGNLEEITDKPESKDNTIVNNINRIDTSIGSLGGITNNDGKNKSIVENINRIDTSIGSLGGITNNDGKNKSIVENINRLDTRINDVVDNISDINDELGNKISKTINISYSDLVDLRDNGSLVPGQKYRITDYVTKAFYNQEYNSAEHPFDIIVEALSENTLSEDAKAINHKYDNPEDDYFRNCNLSAWELKYCINNDTLRFNWATDYGFDSSSYRFLESGLISIEAKYYIIFDNNSNKNYESDKQLTPCDSRTDPDGKENQLCLMDETYNDYYFYYGYTNSSETGITDGRFYDYWRKAEYKDKDGSLELEWDDIVIATEKVVFKEGYMEEFCMSRLTIKEPKGVIYYMKDEWGNEASFDFKNIRLYRSVSFYADPEQIYKLFDKDLYNQVVDQTTTDPQKISNMDGYWYLFSGLYVEQLSEPDNAVIFDDELPMNATTNSVEITDHVEDLSVVNNHNACVQNNIIKQRDIFNISNDVVQFRYHTTTLPRNIFIALVNEDQYVDKIVIYNNTIGFGSNFNLFTVGPTVTRLLGNTINADCYGNYIISSSYCDLKTSGKIETTL